MSQTGTMTADADHPSQPEPGAAAEGQAGAAGVGWDGPEPEPKPSTSGRQTGGRFAPGNKYSRGRKPGAKHKMTLLAESMVGRYAEQIVGRTISLGVKDGNAIALKMLFDRVFPQPKDRPVNFALVEKPTGGLDIEQSIAAIARGVADGTLTPSEASEVGKLITMSAQLTEMADINARLAALEAEMAHGRQKVD